MRWIVRLRQTLWHALWPPVEVEAMEQNLERFLAEQGRSALGAVGVKPEPVLAGRNTLVVRLRRPAGVVYLRAWRYDPAVCPAHEHVHASALFGQAGLATPRVELFEDSAATRRRFRLEFVAERAAEGHSLAQLSPSALALDVVERLGRELARLHGQVGPAWGKPWRPLNPLDAPHTYWNRRIGLFERGLPSHLVELPAPWLAERLRALRAQLHGLDFGKPRLIHGDLAPAHVYLREDGALTWIDFGTVAYAHPAEDFAALRGWLEPAAFAALLRAYAGEGSAGDPPAQPVLDLFNALRLLERLRSRVNKRRRHAAAPPARLAALREEQLRTEHQLRAVWRAAVSQP